MATMSESFMTFNVQDGAIHQSPQNWGRPIPTGPGLKPPLASEIR